MSNSIHPLALVSPQANLGSGNQIGPFVVIEDDVVLGDANVLHSGAVLRNGARLGNGNRVHEHAVIAGEPQDLNFDRNLNTYVRIGNDNVIREGVTIHRATRDAEATCLGNNNYLMNLVHLGHDCRLADRVIIAPAAALGGHVRVDERAFISGGVMIHQFAKVGRLAMIGGNAKITQDVLPYMITDGNPARVRGLNVVGLKRAGLKSEQLRQVKRAYQILFRSGAGLEAAINDLRASGSEYADHLADFVADSRRGFHRDKD